MRRNRTGVPIGRKDVDVDNDKTPVDRLRTMNRPETVARRPDRR